MTKNTVHQILVQSIFIKTRVTVKSSECLWRDVTGHASIPYSTGAIRFASIS